jgi:glycerate-2-kinase
MRAALRRRDDGVAEGDRPGRPERRVPSRAGRDDNDGHGFFGALGDCVVTGPTLTNVNDFRAIVIDHSVRGG